MITLDGSYGEGGGQIIRTALALSTLTQQPFEITNIRAKRDKPGLQAQHLAAVTAAQQLCNAQVEGAVLGSQRIVFQPKKINRQKLLIDIGTAGSITLLLQALLLPAFFSRKNVTLRIIGGTDVQWSQPINYLQEIFVPYIRRYCKNIDVKLSKRGYYPTGGGEVIVSIKPAHHVSDKDSLAELRELLVDTPRINITEKKHLMMIKGISHASTTLEQPRVAERQATSAEQYLKKRFDCPINLRTEYAATTSSGSGIVLLAIFSKTKDDIDADNPHIIGADVLGEKGITAENIGITAAEKLAQYIMSSSAIDQHLADALIPWMALLPGSIIKTTPFTQHTLTNIYVTEKFFGDCIKIDEKKNLISSFKQALQA